jgi:pimeloyl-ACP methyl ester carboxylesterase
VVLLHGLTFDRGMWAPLVGALGARRAVALDLPGHGGSPRRDSYDVHDVVGVLHVAITAAGARTPVLVGHSIGAVLATAYAADHPVRAVLDVDQPLLGGPFAEMLRSVEPVLRGPGYREVWARLRAGMGVDQLSPPLRDLLRSTPRHDLLLGYWRELLEEPTEQLHERRWRELTALRGSGTAFHHVSGAPVDPGYAAWVRSALPQARFTVLPGGGHFPHLARPRELAEILSGWD